MMGAKRKKRYMKRFPVRIGSQMLSRRKLFIRPIMVRSCSDGDKIMGSSSSFGGEQGMTVGEAIIEWERDWRLGVKYRARPPPKGINQRILGRLNKCWSRPAVIVENRIEWVHLGVLAVVDGLSNDARRPIGGEDRRQRLAAI